MDGYELEMTQVIHASEGSEDEDEDRQGQAVLKVQLEDTPARFQSFALNPGANIIGRSNSCDIRIDVSAVSKQHAQIELCKSDIIITDLGSQNGVKIGKRTLQPRVMYNLDYNKEFSMAGLKAWVLHDKENGAGKDTDSDTCSESLLTAAEIAKDQAGAEAWAGVSETSAVACGSVDRPKNVASVLGPSTHDAANKATADASVCNSTTQSSGSFTLPEMPNLDFSQTGSSEETEPCEVDRETKAGGGTAEATAPVASSDGGSNAVVTNDKDAFLCAPTQGFPDNTQEGKSGDALALGGVGSAGAGVQPYGNYAECTEEPYSRRDEVARVEANEVDALNAPTQGFVDAETAQPSADGAEYPEPHFSAHNEVTEGNDEVDRLNAATQGFANDSIALLVDADEENRLNAATQPYADDAECSDAPRSSHDEAANAEVGEVDRLNAPTQGFSDDTAEDLTAQILAPAACTSLDEQEKLNAVTQSIGSHIDNEADTENNFRAPNQPGDKPRRLLSGPCDLSFVLCEASQPCRDDEEEEGDDEYCPATQKDNSPGLKVHALLKHGKEKRQELVDDDETPPLSPKTTVDETPPPSPGFVEESDLDDNNVSMVTARHSLSALDASNATLYEDCATPSNAIGSPVIGIFGRVSAKRRGSGMSLRKKPSCNIVVEFPGQEAAAEPEHQQELLSSKASRKLDYAEQEQAGDEGSSAAEGRGITIGTCLEDAQEGSSSLAGNAGCGLPSPAKGRSSTASIGPSEKDDDAPYLHMSEIEGLDVLATEEGGLATFEETKNATENHVGSDEVVDNCASPASRKTPEPPCSHEEGPKKDESAEVSSNIEEESKIASKRNGKRKQMSKLSRTRKKASKSDVGDGTSEAAGAPARRSSGRQNAGSRMKSLLSLEKRTSASGNFREGGLSQEVSDKQDAVQDVAEKAQDKAVKRGLRHGQRGKGTVKDEQEMAPLPIHREPSPDASWHEKDVEETSLKSGNHELPEGKAKSDQRNQSGDEDEECVMEAPVVASGNKHVEDKVQLPSCSLLECKPDCTYTTVETGFSEPFTSFSQILKDCETAADDGKTEQVDAQKQTAADTTTVDDYEAASTSVNLEQESIAERHRRASRSTENANRIVTRKREEPAAKISLTHHSATRSSGQESSLQPAEVLAEDTPREVEESGAVHPPAQQRSTRAAIRGRLACKKGSKKAASEFEALSTIPETEQAEGGSDINSFSVQPIEDVGEKSLEAPEASVPSQEDETVLHPRSTKTSRRGVKRTTEAAQAGTDTAAVNTEEEDQKGAPASQPGKSTRTRPACQDSESQNESTLDVSLKSDLESIKSLSPRPPRRGRRGEPSQEQNSKAHTKGSEDISIQHVSLQPEPEAAKSFRRRGKTSDAVAESTLADSCTDTESRDSKAPRRRGKAAALSQEKGDKTTVSAAANVAEESSAEHQLEESAGYRRGRKGTRLPPTKQGLPVADSSAESALESDNTEAEVEGTLLPSGRISARLSRKQHSEAASKTDIVKKSPRAPEPQTVGCSQRKRTANLSRKNKAPSEQTDATCPAKRPLNTEPTSPRTNSQRSNPSSEQSQSQETRRRGGKNAAEVSSKVKQEVVESQLKLSPKPTSEPPKARPGRRQASKMPAIAQAPVTRKRDARRGGKQEGEALNSTAPTVETLEEASLLCSPPKAARKKRPVASMSFGETRQESDDDETTGNEEQTLEEMQIKPKPKRKAPVKEPAVKQEVVEEPPTKRGKRRGNLPDVIPVEPERSRSKEENAGASSLSRAKTLKRKPKVLFTGIDCTNEEEVVRELGGAVATTASACTHLVTDKFRRTVKSLCCIGKGTPIVAVSWIKKCQEAKAFVDHAPYLLQDKKAEKSLSFSLSETLAKAATHGGVLRGWNIHATAHVQPSPPDMREIVTCAGGKYLNAIPTRSTTSGNTVIVSCKDDAKICARARNNGVPVVSAEFVLSGLLLYKVDIDAHRLG